MIVKLFIFSSTLHDADCPSAGIPDVPARHHQRHPQQPAQADSPSGEVANTKTNRNTNKKTNLRQIQRQIQDKYKTVPSSTTISN